MGFLHQLAAFIGVMSALADVPVRIRERAIMRFLHQCRAWNPGADRIAPWSHASRRLYLHYVHFLLK
jgi:hypothetical protein